MQGPKAARVLDDAPCLQHSEPPQDAPLYAKPLARFLHAFVVHPEPFIIIFLVDNFLFLYHIYPV